MGLGELVEIKKDEDKKENEAKDEKSEVKEDEIIE